MDLHIRQKLEEYIAENYIPESDFAEAAEEAISRKMECVCFSCPSERDFFPNEACFSATCSDDVDDVDAVDNIDSIDVNNVDDIEALEEKLNERVKHLSDTFSDYLMYLIAQKGLRNVDVYKNAIVDKKTFSKIKNDKNYHPQKLTALCLCIGAKLNMDEAKDLLERAGYALSPCDLTDIIFSFFIENQIYDMTELDIQLEEHGQPCVIQ